MITIYIDNQPHQIREGQNLLAACLSLGFDLPYFCWHPAMHSVGACRQCAVKQFKDENDQRGKIVMACMTPATEGVRISIDDPEARAFRSTVIEWLMVNHPHDCPVCDEGGECHLQDMTVMTGHNYRRFRFKKRTHVNQNLGPFVNHEMNRCIQCYRCVRFYRDYAGGLDFNVFGAHDSVYFGRQTSGILEGEFSGNLVEVCPTGVFTDKTFKKHYTRKWDLATAPSVCIHCSVGCNIIIGARYGRIRRVLNRFNSQINGYFICDRGRYGYEHILSEKRLHGSRIRENGGHKELRTNEEILRHLTPLIDGKRFIGVGSPRATLESNFALQTLVGTENFFHGVPDRDHALVERVISITKMDPTLTPSLDQVKNCDAILILGEDISETAPMLALAVRRAVMDEPRRHLAPKYQLPLWQDQALQEVTQNKPGPLFLATIGKTRLDNLATHRLSAHPEELSHFGFALAHAIDPAAPDAGETSAEMESCVKSIKEALLAARNPLLISGTGLGHAALIEAAANIARALRHQGKNAYLDFVLPHCNSMGLGLLGGRPLSHALEMVSQVDGIIILENEISRSFSSSRTNQFLGGAKTIINLDIMQTPTSDIATLSIPVASYAESEGTLVNQEGRAQRFYRVVPENPNLRESWSWLVEMMALIKNQPERLGKTPHEITTKLAQVNPIFAPLLSLVSWGSETQKIPRESHRASGRTAMTADISVHEPKPADDPGSPLAFSMEGCHGDVPGNLLPRYWSPGWNSVQSLAKFQDEVGGPLRQENPGRRLFESTGNPIKNYFAVSEKIKKNNHGRWQVVPLYHVFGSDELSAAGAAISERIPDPYIAISAKDAAQLNLLENSRIRLIADREQFERPVKIISSLPAGLVGVPMGLPGMPYVEPGTIVDLIAIPDHRDNEK